MSDKGIVPSPNQVILQRGQRKDGTFRKDIMVRAGYVPPDEIPAYQSAGTKFKKQVENAPKPGSLTVEEVVANSNNNNNNSDNNNNANYNFFTPSEEAKPKTKAQKKNEKRRAAKRNKAATNDNNNNVN